MSNSDSDELVTRNVFTFQNESTMVSGAGPGVNFTNTGTSFRNTMMSSTRMLPRFERPRYAESSYNPQSGREVPPMSVRSICDARQRKFDYSLNPQGMGSAFNGNGMGTRSVYNSRAGSPMSVRSIDTSASVSAFDIANALKHEHFSKHDLKVIKEAYNRFVRHKVRKKIDKRRFRKVRRHRRRSGEDSGEQGSDSSISSEDRSTRTGNYNDNMSSARSAITDISTFRRTIKDSNMFRDCSESLQHNMFQKRGASSVNLNNTQMSVMSNRSTLSGFKMPVFKNPANFHDMQSKNASVKLQKERFTNGFLLPSQRFNKSGNTTFIPEHAVITKSQNKLPPVSVMSKESGKNTPTDSEEENIFSSHKPNGNDNERKRSIDQESDDDIFLPNQKRQKPLSPCKNSIEALKQNANAAAEDDNADDFIFAKPTFPVKKLVKEKLISKSAAPSLDTLEEAPIKPPANMKPTQVQTVEDDKEEEVTNATQNTTSMSMRPSFIKRKLFSQKLDISEKRNISTDSLNSPQNSMYGAIQKERKARKLQQVTTQSCLDRDLQKDDNNLLDLIQKLVPMDKMNITNLTNKTDMQSKNLTEDNSEKWDVTNIITTHKDDSDVSDTFTDEEILNLTVKELQKEKVSNKHFEVEKKKTAKENVVLKDKFAKESASKSKEKDAKENGLQKATVAKDSVVKSKEKEVNQPLAIENIFKKPSSIKPNNCRILLEKLPPNMNLQPIKQFWDTDFESDAECTPTKHKNGNSKENLSCKFTGKQPKDSPKKQELYSVLNFKKPGSGSNTTLQNFTFDNTQKFNASTLRIKSHRAPTRNKCDRTADQNPIVTLREPQFKKLNVNSPPKLIAETSNKPQKQTTPKKDKKTQNGKKQVKSIAPESAKKTHKVNDNTKKQNQKVINDEKVTHKIETNSNTKKSPKKPKNKKPIAIENDDKSKQDSKLDQNEKEKNETRSSKSKTSKDKNPKTRKAEKSITRNNSTLTEENNNRPVRSCRLSKSNISTDNSNASLNTTANRTLRSRNVNLSISDKLKKGNNTKEAKTKRSNISFSLPNDKNAVGKRAMKRVTNLSLLKADESDISFSLKDLSPSPRLTRSNSFINNKNNVKKSIFLRNSSQLNDYSLLTNKSIRARIPSKRYLS